MGSPAHNRTALTASGWDINAKNVKGKDYDYEELATFLALLLVDHGDTRVSGARIIEVLNTELGITTLTGPQREKLFGAVSESSHFSPLENSSDFQVHL